MDMPQSNDLTFREPRDAVPLLAPPPELLPGAIPDIASRDTERRAVLGVDGGATKTIVANPPLPVFLSH